MNKKSLKNKIILQKITLNLLLKFLSPQNKSRNKKHKHKNKHRYKMDGIHIRSNNK